MAIDDKWDETDKAFDLLECYRVIRPTLTAMRKLINMIQNDLAFEDAQPSVSMATLMLSRSQMNRRVMAAWSDDLYHIAFVDPTMEISEYTSVSEDVVLRVLREYFDRLGEP